MRLLNLSMHPPRMRPDFRLEVGAHGAEILRTIERQVGDPNCLFTGQVYDRHGVLRVPQERSTLLSPLLDLELLDEDGATVLHGRFTPEPNVWTGFMAVFAILGLSGFAFVMYGFAQMTVGDPPWALWGGPVSLALIAFVYGAAFIGQGLTVDEIYGLRAVVDRALQEHGLRVPPIQRF